MPKLTVPRSGNAPLEFEGELLCLSEGRLRNGQPNSHWHAITIYGVGGTHYVLHIGYRSLRRGEEPRDVALVLDGPAAVAQALKDYAPELDVQGYPPGLAYADKQARLLSDIRRRWNGQISEVLVGVAFAEEARQ